MGQKTQTSPKATAKKTQQDLMLAMEGMHNSACRTKQRNAMTCSLATFTWLRVSSAVAMKLDVTSPPSGVAYMKLKLT